MDQARVSLLRWLRRQLLQPVDVVGDKAEAAPAARLLGGGQPRPDGGFASSADGGASG